jgi:hypothetical protein
MIRAVAHELIDEVAVGGVDLDTVETGLPRALRGPRVLFDRVGDVPPCHLPRPDVCPFSGWRAGFADGRDGGRAQGRISILKIRMRYATRVPQLQEDSSATLVDRIRHDLPAGDVRVRVDSRRSLPAVAPGGDRGSFGDDESGGCALRAILGHQRIRGPRRPCPAPRHRRHDDAARRVPVIRRLEIIRETTSGRWRPPWL